MPNFPLMHNPLLKFPRNSPCMCNSGKKFKLCHLGLLPRMVTMDMAADAKRVLSMIARMAKL